MNRLTKKEDDHYEVLSNRDFAHGGYYADNYYSKLDEAIDKLGELEDVEELCERIKAQPIYIKKYDIIIKRDFTDKHILYDFDEKCIKIRKYDYIYKLVVKEYGKTWALTKEEL